MSDKNRHSQPFIMVLIVTIVLLVLSQFNTQFTFAGYKTKKIEPLADILQKGKFKKVPMTHRVVTDSIIQKDSTDFALRQTDSSNIFDFEHDSTSALSHFLIDGELLYFQQRWGPEHSHY